MTMEQYIEARDKWYVTTLSEAGTLPEDILNGNWEALGISLRVDTYKGEETLCIKGEPIGVSMKMHPDHLQKIKKEQELYLSSKYSA